MNFSTGKQYYLLKANLWLTQKGFICFTGSNILLKTACTGTLHALELFFLFIWVCVKATSSQFDQGKKTNEPIYHEEKRKDVKLCKIMLGSKRTATACPFLRAFVPCRFNFYSSFLHSALHTSLLCDPWTAWMSLIISSRYRMFNDLRSCFFWRLLCIHKYYSSNSIWNEDLNILCGYIYMTRILWDL